LNSNISNVLNFEFKLYEEIWWSCYQASWWNSTLHTIC